MAFLSLFRDVIRKINQWAKRDDRIRRALRRYDGRTVVFNAIGDAVYVFTVTADGISLAVSPPSYPADMYVEMDAEMARKLIRKRHASLLDIQLGRIKLKNITMEDIRLLYLLMKLKWPKAP